MADVATHPHRDTTDPDQQEYHECDIVHSIILRLELFCIFQINYQMLHINILINKNFDNLLGLFVDLSPKMIFHMLGIFKGWLDVDNCIWYNKIDNFSTKIKIMALLYFRLC